MITETRLLAAVWALGLTGTSAGATLAVEGGPVGLLVIALSLALMLSGRSGLAQLDVTPAARDR